MIKTFPVICASLSSKPNPQGVVMHNAAYKAAGLPFTYIATGTDNPAEAIQAMRLLSYRGMGVSIPHKEAVIELLDEIDEDAQKIGAVNTVVNTDGVLRGYNTDFIGTERAIREVCDIDSLKKAVVIGAGGAARAIAYALKKNGAAVYISSRNEEARNTLVRELGLDSGSDIEHQGDFDADIVCNATPDSSVKSPLRVNLHPNARIIFDAVYQERNTALQAQSESLGKSYIHGLRMFLFQGARQFELYTGKDAPIDVMEKAVTEFVFGN